MIFQQFFAASFGLSVENVYYIAIAVLACILGAEIAGIYILINKLRQARKGDGDVQNDEYSSGNSANFALAALSFGAVSATVELALLVLAIAAAVGAFVLCALLAVLYVKGYLLISPKAERAAKEQPAVPAYAPQEDSEPEIEQYADEEVVEYTEDYASDEEAEQAIAELIEGDEVDENAVAQMAVVAEAPNAGAVASSTTVERTVITEGIPNYAGQAPIVEKHIIETTREIIKETNTTTVTEDKSKNPVTEEMMKAIDELKQLGLQLRMEREVAVAHPAQANGEEAPELEEDDTDELDTEDELDAEDEAEREADAEENDDEYESDLFGNERIVGFDEETGCYIIARYRKSCEAKLMQSRPATKKYYSAIRNALMGYEGTKERMSWTIDTYTNEHAQVAKINIRPRTLDLYLALEPSTLEDSVYRGRDVGGKKKYAETPFLYKVNSPRKLALALELVQRACEELGLSPIDIEEVNYEEQYPFTDTETLITRGLIREYLREEKPAATFELDPDHVPQLAEEDETVIPANANFTWEFDNDQPEEEPQEEVVEEVVEEVIEEEPEEVVIEEEPAREEPAPEAPAAGTTTTTTHEVIRTTERHYTERYYGVGVQPEKIEETRTIEVLPEATATSETTEVEEAETDEVQTSVAALFGDDVYEEDEPIEEVVEETIEEEPEEVYEEVYEEVVEEAVEEEPEEVYEEVVEEIYEEIEEEPAEETYEEEVYEEEVYEEPVEESYEEVEAEEEYLEEEVEEEVVEEVVEEYYEEEVLEEPEEEYFEDEEYYEEVVEEEYYEEEPGEEEEYYEEEPGEEEEEYYEEVVEEEYYEEEPEEAYYEEELVDGEEYYEEVEEEIVEEVVEEEEEVQEEPAPAPQAAPVSDVVLLDVCLFDDYFDNGAIVNLETLKQVGLAPEGATRLKVYASGELKGQFTVEANHFTLDAIKAIGDADGDSIMIR